MKAWIVVGVLAGIMLMVAIAKGGTVVTLTCDQCGEEIKATPSWYGDYIIVENRTLPPTGGSVYLMVHYPIVEDTVLCGLGCMREKFFPQDKKEE